MTSASELFSSRRSRVSDWSYSQHYLTNLDGQRSDRIFGINSHHRTSGAGVNSIRNNTRPSVTISESERLPCTVLQAKERLLRRLRGDDDAVPGLSHISISSSNSDFHSESDPLLLSNKHFGLSQEAIVSLQSEVFKSTNKSNENNAASSWDCSICLERFSNGNKLTRLPCSHRFHQDCLRQWIQIRGDCPCCRSNVF